jgi:hypothetical protein
MDLLNGATIKTQKSGNWDLIRGVDENQIFHKQEANHIILDCMLEGY